MKKIALLVLMLMPALAANGFAQTPKLVIATGGIGGVYYYYGTQVSEIVNKNGIAAATAMQTAASVDNMMLIRDKTDPAKNTFFIATVLPDTAYFTVTGKHEKFKEKPVKANILWMMYPNYLHLVTTDKSGIAKLADLQERRVSTGAPGSGTEFTALNLIQAAKIDPAKFKKWEKLGAKES
jgi:TRAP transporter TAXI family solute receptor